MISTIFDRRLSLLLPIFIVGFLAFSNAQERAAVNKTSLCDVARNPERYDNQEVSLKAQYESDGMEWEGLTDSACEELGIALQMRRDTQGKDLLRAALSSGRPGTLDKIVIGTFTGVFHWAPGAHPSRTLSVQSMRGFSVEHRPLPFKVQ